METKPSIKIRPYQTRKELLEEVNSLILLARDNNLPIIASELLELEAVLNGKSYGRNDER